MMPNVIYNGEHNPQIGDIWANGNGWHVLILEKPDIYNANDYVFDVIFLEDGQFDRVSVDWFGWAKVA